MRVLRWILVALLSLVPLLTLVHRDDLGRWDTNRNAMAAPDEFSYLLLADNLLHGHGISTMQTIGRDTFYPPGYPLLLAGWSKFVGLTLFHTHLLNALLVSAATLVVYAFTRRLLALLTENSHRRFNAHREMDEWLALLIAGLFATNWHVLEGALFVFSEPAFMGVTFAWLALGLRWRNWPASVSQTLVLALFAIAAWSIRGAGIVCVGAMGAYALVALAQRVVSRKNASPIWKNVAAIGVIVVLAGVYQFTISRISPEKSLASVNSSDNSYGLQLLHGITKNGTIHDLPSLVGRVVTLAFSHLDDYAAAFTPWFREAPAYLYLNVIGKTFGLFGLLGWSYRLFSRRSSTRFLDIYVLFYMALYLIWPFNMTRFWAPLLPVMLAYSVDALRQFIQSNDVVPPRSAAVMLLSLLLMLSAQELFLQLGNYERRLNYVSDALAASAQTVVRLSPDPTKTIVAVGGTSEHFVFAWYLPRAYLPRSPEPHSVQTGRRETVEEMLLGALGELGKNSPKRLFVISYFTEPRYSDVFATLERQAPEVMARYSVRRVFQKEIITTVWEFVPRAGSESIP